MFDRVVLISMERRADRRERLLAHLSGIHWPFKEPEWFKAIDGDRMPRPAWWTAGGGAWGCILSHRRVLESAINDDVQSLLVLEDDVYFVQDFPVKAAAFLAAVPDDWEQLMFGGQFIRRGIHGTSKVAVAPGVNLVSGVERTHCYAVRGQFLRDLYLKWSEASGHCDHVMGPFQHGRKVYAPEEFLAGQAGGRSDITGREKPPERWVDARNLPVTLFHDRKSMEDARGKTHHAGYSLTSEGMDKGLLAIERSAEPRTAKVAKLRNWIDMIEREAISRTPECLPAIYHPTLDHELIREASRHRQLKNGGSAQATMNGHSLREHRVFRWGEGKEEPESAGPGTELSALLAKMRVLPKPGCKCHQHARKMDRMGADWCEANLETIIGWLREEAKRSKRPFFPLIASSLVKLAIRKARKKMVAA